MREKRRTEEGRKGRSVGFKLKLRNEQRGKAGEGRAEGRPKECHRA